MRTWVSSPHGAVQVCDIVLAVQLWACMVGQASISPALGKESSQMQAVLCTIAFFSIIGLNLGTCIAFFVIIGDLAPPIIAQAAGLTTWVRLWSLSHHMTSPLSLPPPLRPRSP